MSSDKQRLVRQLNEQTRLLSANTVLFSQALADKAAIHSTDNECLDFLIINGSLTAGKLSELTGLTTGAVTAVIDRLEKAGFAKRERDKKDRRVINVFPNIKEINKRIMPHAKSMQNAFNVITEKFSEKDLEIILRFVSEANEVAKEEINKLRK